MFFPEIAMALAWFRIDLPLCFFRDLLYVCWDLQLFYYTHQGFLFFVCILQLDLLLFYCDLATCA